MSQTSENLGSPDAKASGLSGRGDATPWEPISFSGYANYETRLNADGHRETRPIDPAAKARERAAMSPGHRIVHAHMDRAGVIGCWEALADQIDAAVIATAQREAETCPHGEPRFSPKAFERLVAENAVLSNQLGEALMRGNELTAERDSYKASWKQIVELGREDRRDLRERLKNAEAALERYRAGLRAIADEMLEAE